MAIRPQVLLNEHLLCINEPFNPSLCCWTQQLTNVTDGHCPTYERPQMDKRMGSWWVIQLQEKYRHRGALYPYLLISWPNRPVIRYPKPHQTIWPQGESVFSIVGKCRICHNISSEWENWWLHAFSLLGFPILCLQSLVAICKQLADIVYGYHITFSLENDQTARESGSTWDLKHYYCTVRFHFLGWSIDTWPAIHVMFLISKH